MFCISVKRNPIEYRNHIIADSLNVGFSKTRDIESLVQILLVMEKSHSQKYVVGSFPFNDLRVLPDVKYTKIISWILKLIKIISANSIISSYLLHLDAKIYGT